MLQRSTEILRDFDVRPKCMLSIVLSSLPRDDITVSLLRGSWFYFPQNKRNIDFPTCSGPCKTKLCIWNSFISNLSIDPIDLVLTSSLYNIRRCTVLSNSISRQRIYSCRVIFFNHRSKDLSSSFQLNSRIRRSFVSHRERNEFDVGVFTISSVHHWVLCSLRDSRFLNGFSGQSVFLSL